MKLVFATNNPGKLSEGREIAAPFGFQIVSLEEVGKLNPNLAPYAEPEEGEKSYFENAKLKAQSCFNWCGLPSIGDDSGVEVEVMGGAPGITSARYAGVGSSTAMNKAKLLKALERTENRRAKMRCVLCMVDTKGISPMFEGILECDIATQERGRGGFGYDPLLVVAGTGKTLAEHKDVGINVKTHRALAFEKLLYELKGA